MFVYLTYMLKNMILLTILNETHQIIYDNLSLSIQKKEMKYVHFIGVL